jgi:parallel beta-helix repeat protein
VKIIGNTILNCSNIPICVEAAGADGRIAPAGVHRNITISGNTVKGSPKPGILVTSTTGLRIENNTLDLLGGSLPVPGRMRQAGLEGWQPVTEINCQREGSDPE